MFQPIHLQVRPATSSTSTFKTLWTPTDLTFVYTDSKSKKKNKKKKSVASKAGDDSPTVNGTAETADVGAEDDGEDVEDVATPAVCSTTSL